MRKLIYFRLLFFSIIGAFILSMISLFCLKIISETLIADYRAEHLLFMARAIEKSSANRPVSMINVDSYVPLPHMDSSSTEQVERPSYWLVSEKGYVLSSHNQATLPLPWENLIKPSKARVLQSNADIFSLEAQTFIVKLKTAPTTYLIYQDKKAPIGGPIVIVQGILTFTTIAISVFLALSLTAYYLRKKSKEARQVLTRLESGDLKARFEIKRFDQLGNLLLDFNRMAHAIEHLVKRLSDTEMTRSNFLQELGHDLRTPLTSLSASFETIQTHYKQMSEEDRSELFSIVQNDISYFKDLLEKLMVIATVNQPLYKPSAETIDLKEILSIELKSRQNISDKIQWKFETKSRGPCLIKGDHHLISRLFKNALDNSSRYAQDEIHVVLDEQNDNYQVMILDDGPGLTDASLEAFGKRREIRVRTSENAHFSLGLGSVIMRTIVEAHGGSLEIGNILSESGIAGACLSIELRQDKAA